MDIDLEQLRGLMAAMADFQMSELELEKQGERVHLKRGPSGEGILIASPGAPATVPTSAIAGSAAPAAGAGAPVTSAASAPADEDESDSIWITSPFVGTYYEAPSPGTPAFVKVGQTISPGTVLCIVEAMKLMNEIESEVSGTIVEIAGSNGQPVEFGDRLFKIKP